MSNLIRELTAAASSKGIDVVGLLLGNLTHRTAATEKLKIQNEMILALSYKQRQEFIERLCVKLEHESVIMKSFMRLYSELFLFESFQYAAEFYDHFEIILLYKHKIGKKYKELIGYATSPELLEEQKKRNDVIVSYLSKELGNNFLADPEVMKNAKFRKSMSELLLEINVTTLKKMLQPNSKILTLMSAYFHVSRFTRPTIDYLVSCHIPFEYDYTRVRSNNDLLLDIMTEMTNKYSHEQLDTSRIRLGIYQYLSELRFVEGGILTPETREQMDCLLLKLCDYKVYKKYLTLAKEDPNTYANTYAFYCEL